MCQMLPQAGIAYQLELYQNYSIEHFMGQLVRDHGPEERQCKICGKVVQSSGTLPTTWAQSKKSGKVPTAQAQDSPWAGKQRTEYALTS